MATKSYKWQKKGKGAGRHVQLPEWVQASEAWATMKPAPRALYVELKRRFNGSNNGAIILSHRDAAKALNVHRNTIGGLFDTLQERGFIRMTQAPFLGPSGIGRASVWALEEVPLREGVPATKGFASWVNSETPHNKQDKVA
jgi:DNA-binding transcriptional MocR family regulator